MTKFRVFGVPQAAQEGIQDALERAFRAHGLDVPTCALTGAQASSAFEVLAEPTGRAPIHFGLTLEDIPSRNLAGKVDSALRTACASPEVM